MTKQNPEPPPLPGRVLARLTALSRGNSLSVAVFAGLSVGFALTRADWADAGWSALAMAAGVLEYDGQRRLRAGSSRGLAAMIGAQLLLLAVIWTYAWLRWRNFDPEAYWQQIPALAREMLIAQLSAAGLDPVFDRDLFLAFMNQLVCACLVAVTLAYQGGLAAYYAAKAPAVRAALAPAKSPSTAPRAAR